jgi:calreticulin
MSRLLAVSVLALCFSLVAADILFEEKFNDDAWQKRWHKSSWKQSEGSAGDFKQTTGKWYGDAKDKGIQTGPDSKYFALYSELKKPFTNDGKELVLQFSVKHEQDLDCGGGYIKLLPASSKSKMKDFGGETPYSVMFGPDICGFGTRKTHVIFNYKEKNHLVKKDIKCETDQLSHVYTLRLMPNNTYEVLIDLKPVENGSLYEDFDMLPPKKIKDPKAVKPEDWDEREQIADPEDKKPEGWDDIPATIVDPEAKKPEDWDDEDDGEWEAPTIPNPEYKGEWKPKMIKNPKFKGIWVAPDIDNPDFKDDPKLHVQKDVKYIGFELWQVKAGSIFDNIIVADDFAAAKKFAEDTWSKLKEAEKKMFDSISEEEKKKKEEEEAKKKKEEDDDEYDTEDEEDDKDKAPKATLDTDDEEDEKDEL